MKKRKVKRKKKRLGAKRRHVYPYRCKDCGKSRIAFVHARAKMKTCKRCEPELPNPDQMRLL